MCRHRAASEVRVPGAWSATESTWALTQWDRSPWRVLSRGVRASDLHLKGLIHLKVLSEECKWRMGYKGKNGDKESRTEAAAKTPGGERGVVDRVLPAKAAKRSGSGSR